MGRSFGINIAFSAFEITQMNVTCKTSDTILFYKQFQAVEGNFDMRIILQQRKSIVAGGSEGQGKGKQRQMKWHSHDPSCYPGL